MIKVDRDEMHITGNADVIFAELAYTISELAKNDLDTTMTAIAIGLEEHKKEIEKTIEKHMNKGDEE